MPHGVFFPQTPWRSDAILQHPSLCRRIVARFEPKTRAQMVDFRNTHETVFSQGFPASVCPTESFFPSHHGDQMPFYKILVFAGVLWLDSNRKPGLRWSISEIRMRRFSRKVFLHQYASLSLFSPDTMAIRCHFTKS